jgi:hypothetical protein
LTHLEYLQTELEVGIFRETLLHRKHISALLQSLQDDLLGAWPMGPTIPQGACRLSQSIRRVEKSMALPQRFSSVPPQRTTGHVRSPIPTTLPGQPEPQPPYLGAWIQEGDVVEGQYRGEYNGKFLYMDDESVLFRSCVISLKSHTRMVSWGRYFHECG